MQYKYSLWSLSSQYKPTDFFFPVSKTRLYFYFYWILLRSFGEANIAAKRIITDPIISLFPSISQFCPSFPHVWEINAYILSFTINKVVQETDQIWCHPSLLCISSNCCAWQLRKNNNNKQNLFPPVGDIMNMCNRLRECLWPSRRLKSTYLVMHMDDETSAACVNSERLQTLPIGTLPVFVLTQTLARARAHTHTYSHTVLQ